MLHNKPRNLIYVLLILIPFFIYFIRGNSFAPLKLRITTFLSGPIAIFSFPIKELKKIMYYHNTYNEYMRLRKEEALLKSRLIGMDELMKENVRLGKLLGIKRGLVYSSVGARVIGRDPTHWRSSILIDKGEADGIKQGHAVVNAFGVVGKIAEVNETTSRVILLIDPQFSVAALIERSRESVLVSGSLKGDCHAVYLDKDTDVQVGDRLVTSKLSSSFPENLLIGEITFIYNNNRNNNPECVVRPAVAFSQLEEVLVIIN